MMSLKIQFRNGLNNKSPEIVSNFFGAVQRPEFFIDILHINSMLLLQLLLQ